MDSLAGKARAYAARTTCHACQTLCAATCCCATCHRWCLLANRCILANLCLVANLWHLANLSKVSTSSVVDLVASSHCRRFAGLTMTSIVARSRRLAASAPRLGCSNLLGLGCQRLPASLCSNILGLGALRVLATAKLLVDSRILASMYLC